MSPVRSAAVLAALLPSLAHAQPISAPSTASPPTPSASAAVATPPTPPVASTPVPPGAYPPGAYPPGSYPPGMYPPGAYPPGAYPPGAYPPGAYPNGTWPPGAGPYPYPPPGWQAAPPPPAPEPPTVGTKRVWYGWQTLIADGASLALMAAATGTESDGLSGLGVVGFVLASPIVHWSHGNVGRGFGSLGIRAGMPVLGIAAIAAGFPSAYGDGVSSRSNGNGALFALGLVVLVAWIPTAIVVDSVALAYDEKPPTVSFVPVVQPQKGGATFGLGGTF